MKRVLAVSLCLCFIAAGASAVDIDWVTVGNPGNANCKGRKKNVPPGATKVYHLGP